MTTTTIKAQIQIKTKTMMLCLFSACIILLFNNNNINHSIFVNGSIQNMNNLLLEANSQFIQYDEGNIRKSGTIDLSNLIFIPKQHQELQQREHQQLQQEHQFQSNVMIDDDDMKAYNDEINTSIANTESSNNNRIRGRRVATTTVIREEEEEDQEIITINDSTNHIDEYHRRLDGGIDYDPDSTYVDIIIVPIPDICSKSSNTCKWDEIGVGKILKTTVVQQQQQLEATTEESSIQHQYEQKNELRWCCTDESIEHGLCEPQQYGRFMINEQLFPKNGQHRSVQIPSTKSMSLSTDVISKKRVRNPLIHVDGTSTYVVIYANCNDRNGRDVTISGQTIWKSKHGYLPGELYGFMNFYYTVTIIYGLLLLWFLCLMYKYTFHTRIDIEYYIAFAIVLGFTEMLFRSADYIVWNYVGSRSIVVIWCGILLGVCKQGFSRCVAVMVSMGYTMSNDKLVSNKRNMMLLLGLSYVVTATISDCLLSFASKNINKLSYRSEIVIIDTASILNYLEKLINIIFMVLILLSLNSTMKHFKNTTFETNKLQRTKHLHYIFVTSALFTISFWLSFLIIENNNNANNDNDTNSTSGIIAELHAWLKDSASELNFLFVLIGIAILWRPTEHSFDYIYKKLDTKKPHDDFLNTNKKSSSNNKMFEDDDDDDEAQTTALTDEDTSSLETSEDDDQPNNANRRGRKSIKIGIKSNRHQSRRK